MLAVMLLSLTSKGELTYALPDYSMSANLGVAFWKTVLETLIEVAKALALIVVFFAVLQLAVLKLPKKKLLQIAIGIGYTLAGLVIFLTAVKVGFMPVGFKLGSEIAGKSKIFAVATGLILGTVVVLAEPAVHVLNRQV